MSDKLKRVTVYVDADDYQQLRAKLVMLGESVSGWLRKIVKAFLDEDEE